MFKAVAGIDLSQIFVGSFAPGTLARGAIDTQTPTMRQGVTRTSLSISTGGQADCSTGLQTGVQAEAALVKANIAAAGAPAESCLFLAELTFANGESDVRVTGQCDDWRQDLSYCWVEGDAGQFWLRRKRSDPAQMQAILGAFVTKVQPILLAAPGELPPRPVPRLGIMLDSVADDAGRTVADRWLLLPPAVVTLEFRR